MTPGLEPDLVDSLHERAFEVARLVAVLPDHELTELHAAVRERLGRGVDLESLPATLRPLLNRILDVVDRSCIDAGEAIRLERIVFG
jgi:hypothetical protein